METIYTLTTTINGRKNYVANMMQVYSMDKAKKIVHYTTDPHQAKDFGSLPEAEAFVPRIVNPHERIFKAETAEVDPEKLEASADEVTNADLR